VSKKPKPQIPNRAAAADRVLELDSQHCRWPVGEPTSPDFRFCEGFRMTAARDDWAGTEAVVRKPPRKEPAGSEARLLPARYGDLIGMMTAAGQLGVPVR
jgi:hypothetical protein